MSDHHIEIEFKPGGGQIVEETGTLNDGESVEWHFHTSRLRDDPPFNSDWVANGNFFVTADPGNNCQFRGEFRGPGVPENGSPKTGSGQSSISWQFDKPDKANGIVLQPDSDYTVTVTISQDGSPGLNGKLNAGPKHD